MTVRNFPPAPPADPPLPPLRHGERMSLEEFERRDARMPQKPKWELVDGVAYMAAAAYDPHGGGLVCVSHAFTNYAAATPPLRVRSDTTVVLGPFGEPRPDLLIRIPAEAGGRTGIDGKGRIVGGPELVVEVSDSSESFDLGSKRRDYKRGGVLEYLVVCMNSQRLRGFDLPADSEFGPDADGLWRSRIFPGLWIDSAAVLSDDLAALTAALQRGLATPEHAAFAAELAAHRKK